MNYEAILVERSERVGRITLNCPQARNALNQTMVSEIWQALRALATDPEVRAIILRGAGDAAFCAGADLKAMSDRGTTLQARESFSGLAHILEGIPGMRTPVIAQVHGYALAGGCGLAVGCDLVVAAEDAVFGLPEIKVGLLPAIVMAPIVRAVGVKRALALVLTGEPRDVGAGQGGRLHDPGHGVRQIPQVPAGTDHAGRAVGGCPGRDRGVSGQAAAALDRTVGGSVREG